MANRPYIRAMLIRLPQSPAARSDAVFDALNAEVAAEKAASLGRAGKKVEAAMARLRDLSGDADARIELVREAADAVYAFVIQRELCGFADHDAALDLYGVTGEVKARVGAQ